MTFSALGLRPELIRALTDANYQKPTAIQERGIPVVLNDQDLIACAQTGTGKTAAFLLPILHRLSSSPSSKKPRALVLTPTRELAGQIDTMAKTYSKYLRIRSTAVYGGVGIEPQKRRLTRGLDLLIATPGRLLDLTRNKHARVDAIETVILDEADRMLDMGFLPDIKRILSALPAKRQNLFFSATMPDQIETLIRKTAHEPVVVEVARRATPIAAIHQIVHPVMNKEKKNLLKVLLRSAKLGQSLVFARTKARANQLTKTLERSNRRVAVIHSNKSQSARTRALERFRNGEIDTLIATDIASRGIDVDNITHVINFDLPHVPEDYVHRIGRTARAGKSGHAISLVSPEERSQLAAIERLVGKTIERKSVDGFSISTNNTKTRSRPRHRPATNSSPTNSQRRRRNARKKTGPARAA